MTTGAGSGGCPRLDSAGVADDDAAVAGPVPLPSHGLQVPVATFRQPKNGSPVLLFFLITIGNRHPSQIGTSRPTTGPGPPPIALTPISSGPR